MDIDVLKTQAKYERELRERLEQQVKRLVLTVRILEFAMMFVLLGQAPAIATVLGSMLR